MAKQNENKKSVGVGIASVKRHLIIQLLQSQTF